MNEKSPKIILAVGIAAAAVIFFLVMREAEAPREDSMVLPVSPTPASYTIEVLPTTTPVALPTKSAPTLFRALTFPASFNQQAQEIMRKNIGETVARLEKNKSSVDDWILLGVQRKIIDDYTGARQAWEYAEYLAPKNIVTPNNLGDLFHYYLKDYQKSEAEFKKAIANDPSYILSYKNLSDLYLYSYATTTTKALDTLLLSLKNNPKSVDAMLLVANYYREKGDVLNTIVYLEAAYAELVRTGDARAGALQSDINLLKK